MVTLEHGGTWFTGYGGLYVGHTGTGSLNILSGSTVTSNSVFVGATTATGSVLVDGAGSTWNVGTLNLGHMLTGSLTIRQNGTVNVSNAITVGGAGPANLTLQNGGTLNVTASDNRLRLGRDNNSIVTLTIGELGHIAPVAPGTLNVAQIYDNTPRPQGSGDSVIQFNHTSENYVFAPRITGSIVLAQRAGTTILTANSDYNGTGTPDNFTTRIFGGTLQLGNGGATGMITSNVQLQNGTLAFNRSDNVTTSISVHDYSSAFTSIYLRQAGSGDLTLTGSLPSKLNYQLTGSGDLIVTAPLSMNRGSSIASGRIYGPGRLIVAGALGATFSPIVESGTLQLGNGGSGAGLNLANSSINIGLLSNPSTAELAINYSDNITLGGIITGTGIVRKMGSNNLTLSGSLQSGGQLVIEGGQVIATGPMLFGSAGTVSGAGTFVKDGSDVLDVNGRFTQTGGTMVKAGTLNLRGTVVGDTSAFTVESGGTLQINRALSAPITGAGTVILNTSDILSGPLSLTGAFNVTTTNANLNIEGRDQSLAGPVNFANALYVRGNGRITFGGNVTSPGSTGIIVEDSATVRIGQGGATGTTGVDITVASTNSGLEFNRSDDYTVASRIFGDGYIAQAGSGKLTIAATPSTAASKQTWGGTLRLRAGLLTYAANPTNQNGKIFFEGGTLQFHSAFTSDVSARFSSNGNQLYRLHTNGQNITLGGSLASVGGSLTKLGDGTLTLSGNNTYTGGTFVNAGTLRAGGATGLRGGSANADYTISPGAALDLAGHALTMSSLTGGGTLELGSAALTIEQSGNTTYSGAIDGAGRLVKNGAGTLTLNNASSTYSGGTTVNAGVLAIQSNAALGNANGTLSFNGGTLRSLGDIISSRAVTLGNAGGTFDASGGFITLGTGVANRSGETGGLTLASGLLTLTGAQTYTGATAVNNGGTLKLSNGSLATPSVAIASNSTLLFEGANTYGGNTGGAGRMLLESGSTVFIGTATHTGGTILQGGRLQLGDGTTNGSIAGTVNLASGTVFAINRVGSAGTAPTLTGSGTFHKDGAGQLGLGDNRAFTGGVQLNAGLLSIDSEHSLGLNNAGGTLTITGGEIRAGGAARTIQNATTLSGDFRLGRLTNFSGNVALTKNVTITSTNPDADPVARTSTFSGVISGNYGLTFAEGANPIGSIVLSGANTYTGGTTLRGGLVSLQHASGFGTGALTFDGGTLTSGGNMAATLNGTFASGGATIQASNGFFTINGTFGGAGSLAKTGGNLLTFANNQTYTGSTSINAGTLKFAGNVASSALTIGTGAKVIFANSQTYAGAIGGGGVLEHEFSGTTTLTGNATHTGGTVITGGSIQIGDGGTTGSLSGNVTLTGGGALVFNRGDASAYSGQITGAGSLVKTGAGGLTLSGNHSFTGATSVNAGKLFVNGSLANTSLTVASGATLGGSGSIGGSTTVQSGGHLAAGNSPGTLTFTNGLALQSGSVVDFELGEISDLVLITGGVFSGPASGKITVNIFDSGGFTAGTYTLIDATGASLSSIGASSFEIGEAVEGFGYTFSQNDNSFFLTATAVPEPASAAALAGLLTLGLAATRRRRRAAA